MAILQSRIGLLLAPTTAIWTGTVSSYNDTTFEMVVSTVTGTLNDLEPGHAVNMVDSDKYIRIKTITVGTSTFQLSENPQEISIGDPVQVFAARLPFPYYQRATTTGVVYMDYDIAWPGQYLSMPPRAVVYPDIIIAAVGESVPISAVSSEEMAVGASLSTYTWDAGTGGVITGSGASVSVSYSTSGFRYLSITVTDNYGGSSTRYVPCWIGATAEPVAEASLSWRAGDGWTANISLSMGGAAADINFIARTPLALVDLETDEVYFYGWLHPLSVEYDIDGERVSMTALSLLSYIANVYSYAFLLNSVGVGVADEWQEVYDLTLQRAVWHLMRWHSNIHELANVLLEPTARTIQNIEFTAGTLAQQLKTACDDAFWEPRPSRSGGVNIITQPLYSGLFGSMTTLTLAATDVRGKISWSDPMNWISEARVMGLYPAGGGYEPLIVRAPSHPEDLGRPGEVSGLAPLNSTELRGWAARHLALSQVRTYDVKTFVDVDPWTVRRIVLPNSYDIAPESVRLSHDAEALRWTVDVSGRRYGVDVTTVDEPPPPEIVIPPPVTPPIVPPWPPLPDLGWPTGVWVATEDLGVYRSDDFTDPLQVTQPTWIADNVGLPTFPTSGTTVKRFEADPASSVRQAILIVDTVPNPDTYDVYTRADAVADNEWNLVLTNLTAATLVGEGVACRIWDITYDVSNGRLWALVSPTLTLGDNVYPCYTDDQGATWNVAATIDTLAWTYGLVWSGRQRGNEVAFGKAYGAAGRVYYSTDGWASFDRTDSMGGSSWMPYVHIRTNYLYSGGSTMPGGIGGPDLAQISKADLSWTILFDSLNLGIGNFHIFVEDTVDPQRQRLLDNSKIYSTEDEWATLVNSSPATIAPTIRKIHTPVAGQFDMIFLGQYNPNTTYPHVVYIMDGEYGTMYPRAGPNPGTSPYTDSIPNTCGEMRGLAVRF